MGIGAKVLIRAFKALATPTPAQTVLAIHHLGLCGSENTDKAFCCCTDRVFMPDLPVALVEGWCFAGANQDLASRIHERIISTHARPSTVWDAGELPSGKWLTQADMKRLGDISGHKFYVRTPKGEIHTAYPEFLLKVKRFLKVYPPGTFSHFQRLL